MKLENVKNNLLSALERAGVKEYEIYYNSKCETSVETLNKQISTFSSGERGGICLRVIKDGKMGYASTELMSEGEMEELILRALDNAEAVEKKDENGFFEGSESYNTPSNNGYTQMTAEELKDAALSIADKIYSESERVTDGTSSTAVNYEFTVKLLNSHGLELEYTAGVNAALGAAVVLEGEEKQSDYALKKISVGDADTFSEIAKEATEGAEKKLGASLVPSGKYDVVISPAAMRSLLSAFSSSFSAKSALEGMSILKGKEGTEIASSVITLTDDPYREGAPMHFPFDAEGVATKRRVIIDKGILTTLLHNRETAKRMGVKTTANASKPSYSSPIGIRPYSFAIEPGTASREELLKMAEGGIYITGFKGIHAGAKAVTGDFSLESEGFMIESGECKRAVKSFTVAGNFFTLLSAVEAVGSDLDIGVPMGPTGFGSPSVLVRNMSVAGK